MNSFHVWLESISKLISAGEILYFAIGVILTHAITLFVKSRYRRKLRKILGISSLKMQRKQYCISTPAYSKKLYNYEEDIIIQKEAALQERIANILGNLKCECKTFEINVHRTEANEIHIGGLVSNQSTIQYYRNYLKRFTLLQITQKDADVLANENTSGTEDLITVGNNSGIIYQSASSGEQFLEYKDKDRDLAIVLKLTPDILHENKIVHLLWGFQLPGTVAAVEYFIEYCSDIYRRHKNGPYCIIIPYDVQNGKLLLNQIVDITSDMLNYIAANS